MVQEAKYGETTCTAAELALKAMQKQAKLGAQHLANVAADNTASGAQQVKAASDPAAGDPNKPLTKEQRMAQGRADAKAAMKKEDK